MADGGQPLRVCVLARVLPVHTLGGMQDHTAALARGVAAQGHDVTVVTTRLPAGRPLTGLEGVRVVDAGGVPPVRFTARWRKESVRLALEFHRQRAFDVVHAQGSGGTAFLARGWARRLGVGGVLSLHGTAWDEIRTAWGLMWRAPSVREAVTAPLRIAKQVFEHVAFTAPAARRADVVIATSDQQADLIPRLCRIPRERVLTVYNGIDVNLFRPDDKSGRAADAATALVVARLIPEKGIQVALEAVSLLRARGCTVRLVVVGAGSFEAELRRLTHRLGLDEQVEFRGPVALEDLPRHYREADLFLNATIRANGYDLTMVQAQACGVPVVASHIGSTPTALRDGLGGLLIPPGDVRALAGAIGRLVEDQELRRRMGAGGREWVMSRFTEAGMVEATISAYRVAADRARSLARMS